MTHQPGLSWLLITALALTTIACDDGDSDPDDDAATGLDGSAGEGGEGGMGGDADGAAGQGGMGGDPDQGTPIEDQGISDLSPPDPACTEACDGFLLCAPDLCPGADLTVLGNACLTACAANASFAAVLRGTDNCADTVGFVSQQSARIATLCDTEPPPPPMDPLCDDYGLRAAECLTEVCPFAAELGLGATQIFRNFCNEQVANGSIPREQLENIAMAPCNNPLIAPIVNFVTTRGDNPESGALTDLCTNGPTTDGVTCDAACATLRMCIPEGTGEGMGGALRDEGLCRLICGIGVAEVPDATWPCLATAENCGALPMCLQNPPPIEPDFDCTRFAARAVECITETCPPADAYGDDLIGVIDYLCHEAVDDGEAEPDALEAIGPATPCDDEALTGAVTFFTQTLPEEDDSGLLVGVCAGDPPPTDPAICAAACTEFSACIPPGTPADDGGAISDPRVCRVYCTLGAEVPVEVWECVAAADECAAVFACFPEEPDEPPPPPGQ